MELKFVATTRPEKLSPTVQRRQKLVRRIDQQIGYVRQMIEGQQPRAAWVWMDEAGTYFLPIKYGRQPMELKKGMFAVQCKDLDEVEQRRRKCAGHRTTPGCCRALGSGASITRIERM